MVREASAAHFQTTETTFEPLEQLDFFKQLKVLSVLMGIRALAVTAGELYGLNRLAAALQYRNAAALLTFNLRTQ